MNNCAACGSVFVAGRTEEEQCQECDEMGCTRCVTNGICEYCEELLEDERDEDQRS
jgi:hypothetical protein